jgi:hypothetical protein
MFSRKVQASLTAALLFFVISSPFTYKLVDNLVGGLIRTFTPWDATFLKIAEAGCPTNYGLAVHAAVYGMVTYYLMQ